MTQYPTEEMIEAGIAVVKATEKGGRLKSMLTRDDMQAIFLAMRAKEQSHSPTTVEVEQRVMDAMITAHLSDGEGNTYRLFELFDFSGENKSVVLTRQLARAAIATLSPNGVTDDSFYEGRFFVATVSEDGREIGLDHPTDADWGKVKQAHIALRDRLNERLAEEDMCPHKPAELGNGASQSAVERAKSVKSILLPHRCIEAIDEIRSLFTHARTDAVDMVERIERIACAALATAHEGGKNNASK